jgi:predicted nucleic acid-binding protein
MRAITLYLDTSVLGGYYDDEFAEATKELWRQAGIGLFQFFTSTLARTEVEDAPENVRKLFLETFQDATALIDVDEEIAELANAYLAQGVVTRRFADDAVHVAVCTTRRIDFLVSWNFRHLVNIAREKSFNSVNLLRGYHSIRIVNPLELIYGHESQEV